MVLNINEAYSYFLQELKVWKLLATLQICLASVPGPSSSAMAVLLPQCTTKDTPKLILFSAKTGRESNWRPKANNSATVEENFPDLTKLTKLTYL